MLGLSFKFRTWKQCIKICSLLSKIFKFWSLCFPTKTMISSEIHFRSRGRTFLSHLLVFKSVSAGVWAMMGEFKKHPHKKYPNWYIALGNFSFFRFYVLGIWQNIMVWLQYERCTVRPMSLDWVVVVMTVAAGKDRSGKDGK